MPTRGTAAPSTVDPMPVEGPTFAAFADEWASGRLHQRHPDHVPAKDATRDEELLRLYINPVVRDVRVAAFTLDDAERVMASLPAHLSPATRRQVAQVVRRVLTLATYPGRFRAASPIPRGWLPRLSQKLAFQFLYPAEDRQLLGCKVVPLVRRLAYGILAREGLRTEELASLRWRDVSLERGDVELDKNKTDDPRSWALDPSVVGALRAWRERFRPNAGPDDVVIATHASDRLNTEHLAGVFRRDLKLAGVNRPALFERAESRRPIRAHDLRASFVTVKMSQNKGESWVQDRTGHTTSLMLNRYRRAARKWSELRLGDFAPLDEAIPELATSTPAALSGSGADPNHCPAEGGVEAALTEALMRATEAGQWALVGQLAGELAARRRSAG